VALDVDEARAKDQSLSVYDFDILTLEGSRERAARANTGNAIAGNRNLAVEPGVARAIDNAGIANEKGDYGHGRRATTC